MRIIGITGGIGSGKSEVLKYLKDCGAYVIEADSLAHDLMLPGNIAYQETVDYFGSGILNPDNTINRQTLGKTVFNDSNKLKKLNDIVHPAVKEYIINDISEKEKEGRYHLYVIEAALLIEDGYKAVCDELWYIYVDKQERIKRLVSGRGGNEDKYISVMDNQENESFYRDNCDVTIDNSRDFENTKTILNELLKKTIYCGIITD